jgi:hypothetical protein
MATITYQDEMKTKSESIKREMDEILRTINEIR